ncbi:hypothetical protein HELRODRAFT_188793 [Helobdella robusta]|uniref:Uncharacterized protein n=1 Tax=Helobdella robusta TaxID=6412 RepID=T1FQD1_HELRO|nr:hypothetical protein HELRODRAFT_188793 [Helobdella robusta]ESO02649.1 hypothetical protein HELRODRAFT_188793 [Helobdella robusta]
MDNNHNKNNNNNNNSNNNNNKSNNNLDLANTTHQTDILNDVIKEFELTSPGSFVCQNCRNRSPQELAKLVEQANRHSNNRGVMLVINEHQLKASSGSLVNDSKVDNTNNSDDDNNNNNNSNNNNNNNNNNNELFKKLQEELVACKLREAESSLGFKELQQKVTQLSKQWQQFIKDCENPRSSGEIKNRTLLDLKETIMSLKVKETCMVSEYNELKQKLIDLETENHVYKRQEKKLKECINTLEEKLSTSLLREDDLINENKELLRRIDSISTQNEESVIMYKIKYAEQCQKMADMRRKVAELEIENEELLTAYKLNPSVQDGRNNFHNNNNNPHKCHYKRNNNNDDNEPTTPTYGSVTSLEEQQQNVIDLLSNCDMSDIMTESFFADAVFAPVSLPTGLPTNLKTRKNHNDDNNNDGDSFI